VKSTIVISILTHLENRIIIKFCHRKKINNKSNLFNSDPKNMIDLKIDIIYARFNNNIVNNIAVINY